MHETVDFPLVAARAVLHQPRLFAVDRVWKIDARRRTSVDGAGAYLPQFFVRVARPAEPARRAVSVIADNMQRVRVAFEDHGLARCPVGARIVEQADSRPRHQVVEIGAPPLPPRLVVAAYTVAGIDDVEGFVGGLDVGQHVGDLLRAQIRQGCVACTRVDRAIRLPASACPCADCHTMPAIGERVHIQGDETHRANRITPVLPGAELSGPSLAEKRLPVRHSHGGKEVVGADRQEIRFRDDTRPFVRPVPVVVAAVAALPVTRHFVIAPLRMQRDVAHDPEPIRVVAVLRIFEQAEIPRPIHAIIPRQPCVLRIAIGRALGHGHPQPGRRVAADECRTAPRPITVGIQQVINVCVPIHRHHRFLRVDVLTQQAHAVGWRCRLVMLASAHHIAVVLSISRHRPQ